MLLKSCVQWDGMCRVSACVLGEPEHGCCWRRVCCEIMCAAGELQYVQVVVRSIHALGDLGAVGACKLLAS